jgi:hypothetical protein
MKRTLPCKDQGEGFPGRRNKYKDSKAVFNGNLAKQNVGKCGWSQRTEGHSDVRLFWKGRQATWEFDVYTILLGEKKKKLK